MQRKRLWKWYVAASVLLLYLLVTFEPVSPLAYLSSPMFIGWQAVRTEMFFVILVWLGLGCGDLRAVGRVAAFLVTSCCLGVATVSVAAAWIEFTARSRKLEREGVPAVASALEVFFNRHDPTEPFGIGFWALITPSALVALLALLWFFRERLRRSDRVAQPLARLVLITAVGSSSFVLGSMLAEIQAGAGSGEVNISAHVFSPLAVIILGALTAWVSLEKFRPERSTEISEPRGVAADISKITASASRISVTVLVLLYLAISQTSGYGKRVARLVQTRKAFAYDLIDEYSKKPASSPAGSRPRLTRPRVNQYLGESRNGCQPH